MADDAGLAAIVDVAAPHDVGADRLLRPAVQLRQADAFALRLCAVLVLPLQPLVVVFRLQVLAQGDAAALGMGDLAILDDPALGPARGDHALLIRRGRRPLRGGLGDGEAGKRNVAHALRLRAEAAAAHVDLHELAARVTAMEVGVNDRLVRLRVLLGKPGVHGKIGIPGHGGRLRGAHRLQGSNFVHGAVVQVDLARVGNEFRVEPVAAHQRGKGVAVVKEAVGHRALPHAVAQRLPVRHALRAGDDRRALFLGTVGDARVLAPRVARMHGLVVHARRDQHLVARLRQLRRFLDGGKGPLLRPVARLLHICRYVILHGRSSFCCDTRRALPCARRCFPYYTPGTAPMLL